MKYLEGTLSNTKGIPERAAIPKPNCMINTTSESNDETTTYLTMPALAWVPWVLRNHGFLDEGF